MGVNFYFIFSGSVFVNIEEYHKKTGKNVWRTTTVLGRGECFGVS